MSDEALREAYARALTSRSPGERTACPAPETILALVRRQGSDDQRLTVLDHVMRCPACRDEFELLRAVERAARDAARDEAGTSVSAPGRVVGHIAWQQWVPLAAAAAVVLLVALGPGRGLWERSPEPVRGGGEPLALIAPADAIMPSGAPLAFVWRSVPSAERYTLEVLTGAGSVALSRTTADTTLILALPANLAQGDYRWWVIATAGNGSELRSGTRTLRLRAR